MKKYKKYVGKNNWTDLFDHLNNYISDFDAPRGTRDATIRTIWFCYTDNIHIPDYKCNPCRDEINMALNNKVITPQEIKDLIRDGEKYHKLKTKEK
jgi:hypothetical protein